ncbi:hypothetical protein KC315_g2299 [Hortaea werneckii]|nr:hypothetical protein KC315_g2299 [Hortaea werneckii]
MGRQGVERQTSKDITSAVAQKEQTSTFNFFNLPRELRDSIYDESLIFKRKFEDQSGVRLRGRRLVQIHLLLINRQFRDEYLERAEKKTCLVIVDRDRYHGEPLKLPAIMKYTRKLELHLALACDVPDHIVSRCKVTQEVRMHRKWIGNLCDQMQHLESVKINVLIDAHEHVTECEKSILEEEYRFTNLENLTSLEIFHCDYYVGHKGTTCAWNFSRARKVVMRWSAERGELERVKQVGEACASGC